MSPIQSLLCGLLTTSLLTGAALAQIAPPPPPAPPPTPEYVPPPPAPPEMARPPVNIPPPPRDPIADVKYESIVKKDAEGRLLPLKESVEVASLRANPLVTPEAWGQIEPVMADRAAKLERTVVENLDLVEKVEGGIFNDLNVMDIGQVKTVSELVKPLTPAPLVTSLREWNALDANQQRLTERIAQEYRQAYMTQIKTQADEQSAGDPIASASIQTRLLFRDMVDETMDAYDRLLVKASAQFGTIAPKLGLDAVQGPKVQAAQAALKRATTDEARLATMKELFAALTMDQKKTALQAVLPPEKPENTETK